ncbi:carbohydrate ABC transporter substrate-binding protein (CUT1 family) [Kribbella sp. VKM Ac-2569]|uniref:ABC transporter substrate-binding protein n=1 Tax=Kribbella sp. VKM Ac-2569 TaxID=2512220 RepID=UPI00102B9A11|nr:extracellular solute-binding protein [Kribbella sp. VKM Ac-2569]RZT11699.1 carbohydrate ABC transporter substrate-binding protein (CUT1 family) [Kribbella sp. VKM Ac-2569]
MSKAQHGGVSRRGFLGLAGAAIAAPALAACNVSGNSGANKAGGGGALKFWDMPWGTPAYNDLGKKIITDYTGSTKATYQIIQWNGFYQTFSSAIASKTGPAVSSGAGFQAFQFADQGQIAYADNFIESLKKDGTYDDFLPGVLDTMKTDKGYAGVPWQTDVRPFWYNKALLDQAGVSVPTSWDELLAAGKALKKVGVSGFATGAGAGNNLGAHTMVAMMVNNGGGMFDPDGKPDCVTDANIQAMTFVRELANEGIIDSGAVSYTADNLDAQWKNKKAGIGIHTPGLAARAGTTGKDLHVMDPLKSSSGTVAGLFFVNNLMMYTNTPSQEASEAFLKYYLGQIHTYWQSPVGVAVPVLKSIAKADYYAKDPNQVAIVDKWMPVCKTYAAKKTQSFAALAAVDGGQPLAQFAQAMLQGKTDPKAALTTLQQGLESIVKR